MTFRRTLGLSFVMRTASGMFLLTLCACAALPPNSFLDPTKVGKFGLDIHESGIRQILTPRDTPPGLAHATEPTADDLVAYYEDYPIGPGDVLQVTVQDLLIQGQPFGLVLAVSPLGEIRIPLLGSIKVVGLTEPELEQELTARLIEADLLPKPIVMIMVQSRRSMQFSILGAVARAGPYPITEPNMRLLDVVAMVGDVGATSKRLYVIRRSDAGVGQTMPEAPPVVAGPEAAPEQEAEWVIPPPVVEDEESFAPALMLGSAPGPQEKVDRAAGQDIARDELAEIISPGDAQTQPATQKSVAGQPAWQPLIFDPATGEVLEAEPPSAPQAQVAPRPTEPIDETDETDDLDLPFDWGDVDEFALEQRVIAIPIGELKNGNPRYNIVIRSRDVINVPIDTGVFYMMGEVVRPGVYAFGGRDITLKQALATVGGFGPFAWPRRCEVIRQEPGTDKQLTIPVNVDAIFAGLEDDFYLRDSDIVNVGTHIAAPFLFVIRNSFRFTYGFGFVFDRNFADRYSYGGRTNPESLARQQRSQRGLPF